MYIVHIQSIPNKRVIVIRKESNREKGAIALAIEKREL